MLEEKDLKAIKDKACAEISKVTRRMEQTSEVPKADWECLVLALKAYEKTLNIESMERTGFSGYSGNYGYSEAGRDSMGRYTSRDNYSGYYGNSYDNQVIDDMMRHASPQERDVLMRMRLR